MSSAPTRPPRPPAVQVRDQARRFITLVDELYNARCLLVAAAAVPPDQLFAGAEGQEPILDLEGLQFETAVEGEWKGHSRRLAAAGSKQLALGLGGLLQGSAVLYARSLVLRLCVGRGKRRRCEGAGGHSTVHPGTGGGPR